MKLTALDRLTMAFAPRWTLGRVRARTLIETLSARHYEAATPGRRTQGWARSNTDADAALRIALPELRLHARDLLRNNAWARRARQVVANNTVGWGIIPKAVGKDAGVNAKAMELWKNWAETTECESEGRHTFSGMQHLAMKSIFESGEILIRRRFRKAKDNLTIPLQLQVLEPDYLDHARSLLADESKAGGPIIQGVEFDKLGRRAAYWLFEEHPGSGRNIGPSKRVPASEVLHVYYCERSGQSRGVSWLSSAILKLKDFDEYEDATLMKQKVAALMAAFVTDLDGQATPLGAQSTTDPLVETLEPGMISYLPPGRDVKFSNPPPVADESFTTRTLRNIAAGIGITYEDLSQDYSQVNFSSARMSRLAHWQNVHDWRWNMLIPLLCNGVWAWAMEAAQLAGELPEGDLPAAQWTCPPMPMIEPDKEGLALSRLVRNGVMTHDEMVREQGGDPDTHWPEYANGLKRLDSLGIKLDSDVRAVTQAGLEQPVDSAPSADSAPPPAKQKP